MKLTFLGTRGAHVEPGNGHNRHSALLLEHDDGKLLVDCGSDWPGLLAELRPDALVLTHAHDDHAGGLGHQPPCPVWATAMTWQLLDRLDLGTDAERHTLSPRQTCQVGPFQLEAWPVVHSFRAPTVALRITAGNKRIFYAPDLVALPDPEAALNNVDLFIGDGAAFDTSMQRVEEGQLCGHAPLPLQLSWCMRADVPRMLITHCGKTLVSQQAHTALKPLAEHAEELGIELDVAHDGEHLDLTKALAPFTLETDASSR